MAAAAPFLLAAAPVDVVASPRVAAGGLCPRVAAGGLSLSVGEEAPGRWSHFIIASWGGEGETLRADDLGPQTCRHIAT